MHGYPNQKIYYFCLLQRRELRSEDLSAHQPSGLQPVSAHHTPIHKPWDARKYRYLASPTNGTDRSVSMARAV